MAGHDHGLRKYDMQCESCKSMIDEIEIASISGFDMF